VIAYDLDRLSRKLAHQLLLSEELEQAGVALHIVTMPDGAKTPETQLLANVRGIIAEYERAKILERTTRGQRGRAQAGHIPGGTIPLGYVAQGDQYVVSPEEAALVQRIFALYLDGMSQEAIAALLTREGITPPGDRKPGPGRRLAVSVWHQGTIHDVLHNAAYVGTLYYGKRQRIPGARNPDKKTRWRAVESDAWIAMPVPPILDEATFQAVQAIAQRNRSQSKRNRKYEYLLVGGRLRCGQCGSAMSGRHDSRGWRGYRCPRRPVLDVVAPHTKRSMIARDIETFVWEEVERALHNPSLIIAELERRREGTSAQQIDLGSERQHYTRQLAQCDKDLKRWEAAYLGEAIDLDDFKTKKAEVDTRRLSAERELVRLDEQQLLLEQAEFETASLVEYCVRVRQELQHFTLEEKRLALDALNITVTWHPDWPTPKIEGGIDMDIINNAPQRMDSSKTSPPTGS
jgi:site-specific DNA recombinase